MKIISKKNKGVIGTLSKTEENIICNPNDYDQIQRRPLIEKLEKIKSSSWLQCSCSGKDPVVVICAKENVLYLRCKNIDGHQEACYFRQKSKVYLSQNAGVFFPKKRPLTFDLYKQTNTIGSSEQNDPPEEGQKSIPKLGKLLYAILQDAKCTLFRSEQTDLTLIEQLESITEAFNDPEKKISKTLALGDYYRYALQRKYLDNAAYHLKKNRVEWPNSLKSFMVFTSLCTKIDEHTFTTKNNETFEVENSITLPSAWISRLKSKPYFLITAAVLDDEEDLYFKDAFAVPILSTKRIMPVESHYERQCMWDILKVMRMFKGINFKIEKPLFCLYNEKKEPFRPDFIVTLNDQFTIYIEVLGVQNHTYALHKRVIEERAQTSCDDYLSIEAFKGFGAAQDFKAHLSQTIRRMTRS